MSIAASLHCADWFCFLPVQTMITTNTVKKHPNKTLSISVPGTYMGAGRQLIFLLRNVLLYLFSTVCTAFFPPLLSNCRESFSLFSRETHNLHPALNSKLIALKILPSLFRDWDLRVSKVCPWEEKTKWTSGNGENIQHLLQLLSPSLLLLLFVLRAFEPLL